MENVASLFSKAQDCLKNKRFKQAERVLKQVIELDPKQTEAFYNLGNIYHQRGEIGKAIKAFQKVLSLDEAHTDASISLSVLYNDIGKYDLGKNIFEKAQKRIKTDRVSDSINDKHINSRFSKKHFEIAELYMTYNRFDDAIFEYKKSSELDPDNLEARVKLAKVYAKKGFHSRAVDELKRIRSERPNYMAARVALGILHYGSNNVIEARAEWERVLEIEPLNRDAQMYLKLSSSATETKFNLQ